VEQAKAEYAAREETTRESLALALKERERIELEAEEKAFQARKEAQRSAAEVTERMNAALE
jgi:Ethanolamine utilization protein EutJ (predicted chaperonin)